MTRLHASSASCRGSFVGSSLGPAASAAVWFPPRVVTWIGMVILASFAVISIGCSDDGNSTQTRELWALGSPDLSATEPAVRDLLAETRAELDELMVTDGGERSQALGAAMGKQGKLYHAHGFLEAAEACYLNAEMLAPHELAWPYLLGRLYRQRGQPELAEPKWQQVLELRPGHLPTLLGLGHLRREQGRLQEAAVGFDEALRRDDRSAAAWIGLGRVALARDDFQASVDALERALKLSPSATEIYYPLGLAYRGLGRMEEARSFLARRGTVAAPIADPLMEEIKALETGMRLHLNRGNSEFAAERFEDAARSFKKAVEADPQSVLARMNLAAALTRLGDSAGALEHTQRSLELESDHARANFGMATLLARQGRDQDSIEFYRRAVQKDPSYQDAHFNFANALRRLGRYDEAARHFQEVIQLEPHHAHSRLGLALSLAQAKEWRRAMAVVEESYALLDGHDVAADALVRMLSACPVTELRDGRRALSVAQGLFERSKTLNHLESLAMALAEVGDFKRAVEYQSTAVEAAKKSGSPMVQRRAAKALERYQRGQPGRDPWPP